MLRFPCALLLLVTCLTAADVTGKWAGQLSPMDGSNERPQACYIVLKQVDQTVTGTAGPDESHQSPITSGKVEGNKFTFILSMGKGSMLFEMTPNGDRMEGQVKMTRDGDTQVVNIAVKRLVP
jgi:hypothetical protein